MVDASKQEMLLAVDLWNRRGSEANTSAFVVHAQIAWLYLCHARFERDGVDYWYRNNGRRIRRNGEFQSWDLSRCVKEAFSEDDHPTRRNIEFFIAIRNKIEHRWERGLGAIFGGKIQALVLNYETALGEWFGDSLADELRFPLFLSSLTDDAVEAIVRVWNELPAELSSFIQGLEDRVPEAVATDLRYEFKVALIPYTGSRTGSLVAMTFVREDSLTDEQRAALRQAVTIIRDKQVPVQHLNELKPSAVAARVQEALGCWFRPTPHHSNAWRYYEVRPAPGDEHPERTDARYCLYSAVYDSYTYSEAWVRKLVAELQDPEVFQRVTGQPQVPLPDLTA